VEQFASWMRTRGGRVRRRRLPVGCHRCQRVWLSSSIWLPVESPGSLSPVSGGCSRRDSGFTSEQARALVAVDPTVTPEEVVAFDEVGIAADARIGWVEAGFSAAHARAWTDVDVFPQEARVWRAMGLSVDDARRHRAGGGALPDDAQVGSFGYSGGRADRNHGVTDPPGTRGRLATNAAHDRDR